MEKTALKELKRIRRAEERFRKAAHWRAEVEWKKAFEERVPDKALEALKKGFDFAFRTVFNRGTNVIGALTFDTGNKYDKEADEENSLLTLLKKSPAFRNSVNSLLTTAEGVALGSLGIGVPDMVLWTGMLLKGVYEEAESHGYSYESVEEKFFILKILEASMRTGEDFDRLNHEIEMEMVNTAHVIPDAVDVDEQIDKTSDAFATDMIVTKFIQSIPVVGIAGGLTNPIYYNRVIRYVNLQYRKRKIFDNYNN